MEEDERIRKELIAFLKYYHTGEGNSVKYDDSWIAWLEKQGEKPNNVYDKELSEILGSVICRYINDPNISYTEREKVSRKIIPYVERLEKQGEQKTTEEIASNTDYISPKDKALFEIATVLSQHEDKDGSPLEEIRSILINYEINNLKSTEQKPADKVEPKFKQGDIIKEKETGNLFYINSVEDFGYTLHYKDCIAKGCTMDFKYEDNYELVEQTPT